MTKMRGWWCLYLAVAVTACDGGSTDPQPCETSADCDDGNWCTDDICEDFTCQAVPNTLVCSDGDSCTADDRCTEGECRGVPLDADGDGFVSDQCGGDDCDDREVSVYPGAREGPAGLVSCDDRLDNDCDGKIDEADDGCSLCTADAECDDGDACSGQESCIEGLCVLGEPFSCDDFNSCTDDFCLAGGECDFRPNTAACDDGDACTVGDSCTGGTCRSGSLRDEDGDGHPALLCGGDDCDDLRAAAHPLAEESDAVGNCSNGVDDDCDGQTDSQESQCSGDDPYSDVLGLHDDELRAALEDRVDGHRSLGYDNAKRVMFSDLDNIDGRVQCVYTGEWVDTTGIPPNDVMNTEHSWCQSWGADTEPARSDLHHLFPAMSTVNSRRNNLPYGWVVDVLWTGGGSLYGNDATGQRVFEPRDAHKGDAARALFYFAVRYNMSMPEPMESAMRQFNALDPPDTKETTRNSDIEELQLNRNPFVDRPGLVDAISDF